MKDWIKICIADGALAGWLCLLVAVGLLVGGAITPPPFVIDSSILTAVAELMGFVVAFKLPNMIKSIKDGGKVSFKKGELEVSLEKEK